MYDCRYPDLLKEPRLDEDWLIIHTMLVNGCDIARSEKLGDARDSECRGAGRHHTSPRYSTTIPRCGPIKFVGKCLGKGSMAGIAGPTQERGHLEGVSPVRQDLCTVRYPVSP